MFPVYEPQTEITETTGRKTFKFDFAAGDFVTKDGKVQVVDGVNALQTRVEKVLRTEKFKFKVYESDGDEYGATLLEYINSGYPIQFIESEIDREITDVLSLDDEVLSVTDFEFSRGKRKLTATFKVNTIYGEALEFGI